VGIFRVVWESRDARDLLIIGGIGALTWFVDEILGALGKGQFKTPLNVSAVMICILIGWKWVTTAYETVANAFGIVP
jgi:hypothetical protein